MSLSIQAAAGVLVLASLATAGIGVPTAHAGTAKQGDGTPICAFSGFTYDPATRSLTIACQDAPPPPPPPPPPPACTSTASGSFSFWLPQSGPHRAGDGVGLQVTRSYATNCAYTLTWTVTAPAGVTVNVNGNTSGTGTIAFADQDYVPKPPLVTTTASADATVDITLSGTVPGGVTPFATHRLEIQGSGPPPVNGCTTGAAQQTGTFTVGNQKIVLPLRPGETGAVAFTPTAASGVIVLSTTDTINTPADADHEVTISSCPNDFGESISPFCRYGANFVGSSRWVNTGTQSPVMPYHCPVEAGKTYYMNVRQVKIGTTVNSCNGPGYLNGACEVRLQNTGL